MYINKLLKKYPKELLESDLSGWAYDEPVCGGGYLTKHARKRCKERNVDESDAILNKPNCTSKDIKKINIQEQPIDKCVHSWIWLKERIHNKGDGKGKYKAYKCQKCKAFQRRYI